jgi:adenylate kinase
MYLLLLGAPGAGKGTQATALAASLGVVHVSSGDLFRDNIGQGTELGTLAKGYMDRGELVPDDVTVRMVLDRLHRDDAAGGAILDGFPRTLPQAEALDVALAAEGRVLDLAIAIDVERDELLRRLGGRWICRACQAPFRTEANGISGDCTRTGKPGTATLESPRVDVCGSELYQRSDDSMETARTRLQVYADQTEPLLAYYDGRGVLRHVDGNQTVDAVRQSLLAVAQPQRLAG